ncbi:S8 family serine peptidase [Gluconobacter oxydans]|uniref:S8 family serine peptidase n=1 Tax=Gluconobacter oxydans TaxID=442 RepID=UPI0039EB82C8
MAETPRHPLLNPVLRFTKDPKPEGISGGGKNAKGIKVDRLPGQRQSLSLQFSALAAEVTKRPHFDGRVIMYAAMFDDSLAPTWTPGDLFQAARNAHLIAPYRAGYLVEVAANRLADFAQLVQKTTLAKDEVDISRVESVRFFADADAAGASTLNAIWEAATETDGGRPFVVWLMPLRGREAAENLIQNFAALRDGTISPPPPLLADVTAALDANVPAAMRHSLRTAVTAGDRFSLAVREYRLHRRARTTVIVPTPAALQQLVASGTVFRIEPVQPISSTSPGEGREPERPLPADMKSLPIVGIVDGGMSASSYRHAEAWRATPPFIRDSIADLKHGNRVTSLIVQGHDWNNNLTLPSLYCQFGTVQAVPRDNAGALVNPQDFIAYLDSVMTANPETKVWNFSLNQKQECPLDSISPLGHDIALLARKHRILPIISIGNKPGNRLQPPADCEAAVTIGGRLHGDNGAPGGECPVSLVGPGPSSMLKPDLSHFSHVRTLGGTIISGSSFSTALTSPVAAHTMQRVREASPDLVKALLLHNADGQGFDPALGFGTPAVTSLPWECRPGFVTLQWRAALRPGAAYYWELPIPQSMRQSGKLRGIGSLTAILNPHPMVTDYAGPNYFSVRLASALQYQRGKTPKGATKFHNLLGSLDTEKITEQDARTIDHKWSPIRHHKNDFQSVSFDGDTLRVYARVYARDLYLYGYTASEEVPEMEAVFVLSLGTGDENDDVYNEMRNQLGVFVETAVIESDIDIDNQEG